MYYAKQIDESGNIVALHSMDRPFPSEATHFISITEEEYLTLLAEFEKAMKENNDAVTEQI